ncbi:hypothetical protein [Halopseudomonas yangmingensis]|uniref:DUF2232 domain-containing protein n=1 Tax=Halopseudomonas yangmingensis TaxID=1720063 RepID=A0A1I4NAE4_9GAMM|nr:hypothetical protein [Halopseudomonas yangmingensis]SFM12459.1 hypothetical protein SAMN05216217_101172 [Halopseudomonas yangmingensis]
MRGLAEYVMRGRREATLVVGVALAVPLMFWLGAAVMALVILRRGLNDALPVALWGGLPAVVWAVLGDSTPLLVLVSVIALSHLLRQRRSWALVLLVSVPLGLLMALLLMSLMHDVLQQVAAHFIEVWPKVLQDMGHQVDEQLTARIQPLVMPLMAGLLAATHVLFALGSLMLGRSMQARLYNPGGFREEFHALRLPPLAAFGLAVLVLLSLQAADLAMLFPLAVLPLLLSGVALVHGLIGLKQLNTGWLIGFYLFALFMLQIAFVLIMLFACIDSLFDFRGRLRGNAGSGDDPDSQN